jgi:hypothetical protein
VRQDIGNRGAQVKKTGSKRSQQGKFWTLFGSTAAVSMSIGLSSVWAQELFVVQWNSSEVTVYSRTQAGNTAPRRVLAGPNTGLGQYLMGVAADPAHSELLVARVLPGASPSSEVLTYDRTQSGDTTPIRTFQIPGQVLFDGGFCLDNVHDLRNANTYGFGEVVATLAYAVPGDVPLAGDWNGDGSELRVLTRTIASACWLRVPAALARRKDKSSRIARAGGDLLTLAGSCGYWYRGIEAIESCTIAVAAPNTILDTSASCIRPIIRWLSPTRC